MDTINSIFCVLLDDAWTIIGMMIVRCSSAELFLPEGGIIDLIRCGHGFVLY